MNVTEPMLVMARPGDKEQYIAFETSDDSDSLYITYSLTYSPEQKGVHYYYFVAQHNGNRAAIKRKGASEGKFDGEELFQLTVYDSAFDTPDWLKGGVMYQIFPDRFAKAEDPEAPPYSIDRVIHSDWNDMPEWRPNEQGLITNNDYYGGNFKGIESKLPYLRDLGVTVIYLTPIFESHENHRYNTANYEKVDRMLGSESRLC
jgi:hypothetical protein